MARDHKPEEIIAKLREAEIVLAQGGTVADACRRIVIKAADQFHTRTTRPNEMWQTDFT